MAAALESCRPFSSDLSLIRRLNYSLKHGQRDRPTVSAGSSRAPLRVDVPLLDPCSGHLTPGSAVSLKLRNPQPFIRLPHVPSDLWVPPGLRGRARTENPRTVSLILDMSPEKDWNSRRVHHSALRARINVAELSATSASPSSPLRHQMKYRPIPKISPFSANPDEDPPKCMAQAVSSGITLKSAQQAPVSPEQWISEEVRHYIYTSATQRSYEDVNWDRKLPRRPKAPDLTLEKMVDPVRVSSSRRYHERPQLWQSAGAEWNRRQLRSQEDVRKPFSFCSGCPRSGQIPLYTGVIGSTNPEDIDNPDKPFTPLTLKRSVQPPYTPTARRTTIPGYTGRGVYADASDGSSPAQSMGSLGVLQSPSLVRSAPLSRLVTTTSPWNPFTKNPVSRPTQSR